MATPEEEAAAFAQVLIDAIADEVPGKGGQRNLIRLLIEATEAAQQKTIRFNNGVMQVLVARLDELENAPPDATASRSDNATDGGQA